MYVCMYYIISRWPRVLLFIKIYYLYVSGIVVCMLHLFRLIFYNNLFLFWHIALLHLLFYVRVSSLSLINFIFSLDLSTQ